VSAAASRRQLHNELLRLRQYAGLTQAEVAEANEWSPSKVHRIEKGHVSISKPDLLALLSRYGVTDQAVIASMLELARMSRYQPMPFAKYRNVFTPEMIRFFGYEASASLIAELVLLVIPGLLQTADYTRALIRDGHGVSDAKKLEIFIESRQERQKIIDDPSRPTMSFLLDEAVLYRSLGGSRVMTGQLEHLLVMARKPNVTIRVLPLALGADARLRGSFVLLTLAGGPDADIVYTENRREDTLFENDPVVAEAYRAVFQDLEQRASAPDDLNLYVERALDMLQSDGSRQPWTADSRWGPLEQR
jgi:transcriptional regulator with XRE-family HTH domain